MPYSRFALDHRSITLWSPLVALVLILNIRWFALTEPNEAPKWAVLTLTGTVITLTGVFGRFLFCQHATNSVGAPRNCPLSWPAIGVWIFLIWVGIGVTYAVNPGAAMNRWVFWCCAGVLVSAIAQSTRQQHVALRHWLRWAVTVSAMFLCADFWHGFFVDFKQPGFNTFVMFSRIGHFNYTADVLVILIPLLVWTVLTGAGIWLKCLASLALTSSAFMLVTSGSLGGMGGLLVGGGVVMMVFLARKLGGLRGGDYPVPAKRPWIRTWAYGLLLLFSLGLAGKSLYPYIPQQYRDLMLTRAEWWAAPKTNAIDNAHHLPPLAPLWLAIAPYLGARTPMWASTAGMIADHPWRGHGTGSYLFEYPAFEKRYDLFKDPETLGNQIRTDPHNVLLWIAAENGLPVMLLFAGLFVWLVLRVTRQAWRTPDAFWLCGVWALWAAGLDAQVNQVFFSPASLFMVGLACGLWYGALPAGMQEEPMRRCGFWRNPLIATLCVTTTLWMASYPMTWLVSDFFASEARRLESNPSPTSYRQILLTWVNARRWSPTNANALYGLANAAFNQKHYSGAEGYLKAFLQLAPYHSPGLNLLANMQLNDKRYDEAEQTLQRALKIEPDVPVLRENLEALQKARAQAPPPTPDKDANTQSPPH